MTPIDIILSLIIVFIVAGIYTAFDRKSEKFRMKFLYHEKLWLNYMRNLAFVSVIYGIATLIFF